MDCLMRSGVTIFGVVCLMGLVSVVALADEPASGFVSKPFEWPDYGGTPDIKVDKEVGLRVDELREYLGRLRSADLSTRAEAVREIVKNAKGSEASIREILFGRHGVKNTEMKYAIREARRRGGEGATLVRTLVEMDPTDTEHGQGTSGALRILSLVTALDTLETMAAFKIMIEFSPRHAGVFRHEIGRMLVAHGLGVLPALIYSRGSDNREIHMFAVKWMRDMGNPLLSEQVKVKNPRRLAQLLEAYASVNDLDAIDVTLSLTNHDSVIVRRAARKCITHYGKNAKWPIRRLYENTFSKEPEDGEVGDWATALYNHFDTKRLRPMTRLFEQGLSAHQAGEFDKMEAAFREVLRNEPMFPKRSEMAACYLEFATSLAEDDRNEDAKQKLSMADRLAEDGSEVSRRVRASVTFRKAEDLRKAGTVDPELYKKVLDYDPDHQMARVRYETLTGKRPPTLSLVIKSIAVSLIVFLAAMLVMRRIRTKE